MAQRLLAAIVAQPRVAAGNRATARAAAPNQPIRASAQGLFMLMTNGVGAVLGSLVAGFAIDHFFTDHSCNDTVAICKDWHDIWLAFAAYALLMAILFVPLFRHRHVHGELVSAQPQPDGAALP